MRTSQKYLIALVAVLAGGSLWLFGVEQTDSAQTKNPIVKQDSALAFAVNNCDGITEKATISLSQAVVVEFQKLEIAGRKARVFKVCMKDHGYSENPAWTKYTAPIAEQNAKRANISVDEAFENLRRADMMMPTAKQNTPLFWVQLH